MAEKTWCYQQAVVDHLCCSIVISLVQRQVSKAIRDVGNAYLVAKITKQHQRFFQVLLRCVVVPPVQLQCAEMTTNRQY